MSRLTPRFLIWVYLLLLGLIIFLTVVIFQLYGGLANTTKQVSNPEAQKAAVTTFGSIAQSFADLVKVAVGAVIGALSATLQSVLSQGITKKEEPTSPVSDSATITAANPVS